MKKKPHIPTTADTAGHVLAVKRPAGGELSKDEREQMLAEARGNLRRRRA